MCVTVVTYAGEYLTQLRSSALGVKHRGMRSMLGNSFQYSRVSVEDWALIVLWCPNWKEREMKSSDMLSMIMLLMSLLSHKP